MTQQRTQTAREFLYSLNLPKVVEYSEQQIIENLMDIRSTIGNFALEGCVIKDWQELGFILNEMGFLSDEEHYRLSHKDTAFLIDLTNRLKENGYKVEDLYNGI